MMNSKRVLVALGDENTSAEQLRFVLNHRWPVDAQFMLIHIGNLINVSSDSKSNKEALLQGKHYVSDLLANYAQKIRRNLRCAVYTKCLPGKVASEVIAEILQWDADLLIAGSHGKGDLQRWLLGSVSETLLKYVRCPVVVIRPAKEKRANRAGYNKVLVCVQDYAESQIAINQLIQHKWPAKVKFAAVHVVNAKILDDIDIGISQDLRNKNEMQALAVLKLVAAEIREAFPGRIVDEIVLVGDPIKLLLEHASLWGADLIVMGVHPEAEFSDEKTGVSTDLLTRAKCSVALVRAETKEIAKLPINSDCLV